MRPLAYLVAIAIVVFFGIWTVAIASGPDVTEVVCQKAHSNSWATLTAFVMLAVAAATCIAAWDDRR